jgi:hypothetical protein
LDALRLRLLSRVAGPGVVGFSPVGTAKKAACTSICGDLVNSLAFKMCDLLGGFQRRKGEKISPNPGPFQAQMRPKSTKNRPKTQF